MGILYLECERKLNLKAIASAVYLTLKQIDNLKAEVIFVDKDEIQRLNREQRGVDKITDVLSFPTLDGVRGKILHKKDYKTEIDGKYLFIGSVVINEDKVKEQAKEFMHSEARERTYLIIHSLMHLMGYDHMIEEDKKEMREKEKQALELLGIKEE